jgi:hypothetical protein
MRQALRKKIPLVSDQQGQKQGKPEQFIVSDLREMQENQWVSEIRIDKQEFVIQREMNREENAFLSCHP